MPAQVEASRAVGLHHWRSVASASAVYAEISWLAEALQGFPQHVLKLRTSHSMMPNFLKAAEVLGSETTVVGSKRILHHCTSLHLAEQLQGIIDVHRAPMPSVAQMSDVRHVFSSSSLIE